jgi:hypothetical protein
MWKKPNEAQNLFASSFGCRQCKELKSRGEVSKVLVDVWHEGGQFEGIYSELLEVRECGKIPQGISAKPFRGKGESVIVFLFFKNRNL